MFSKSNRKPLKQYVALPTKLRNGEKLTAQEIVSLIEIYGYPASRFDLFLARAKEYKLDETFAIELHKKREFKTGDSIDVYIDAFYEILKQETDAKKLEIIVDMFNRYSSVSKGFNHVYDVKFNKMEITLETAFFKLANRCIKKAYNEKYKQELEEAKILEA